MYVEVVVKTHVGSFLDTSVSVDSYEPCLDDFCGQCSFGVINQPFWLSQFFSLFSVELPKLCLIFGCGSGGSLSAPGLGADTLSIAEYH